MNEKSNNESSADNQQERLSTIAWYIVGFVDGEGSFNISFRRKSDYTMKWQPVLSFNVSQKERTMLDLMKRTFDCGIIKRRKDGLHSYDVTNPKDLLKKVILFFEKNTFISKSKKRNFLLFKQATVVMSKKRHLTAAGLKELVAIREQINVGAGRTRKYTARDVLQSLGLESSETIRQDPTPIGRG